MWYKSRVKRTIPQWLTVTSITMTILRRDGDLVFIGILQ